MDNLEALLGIPVFPCDHANVKILSGSGHFLIEPSDNRFAEVIFNDEVSAVEILPKSNGVFTLFVYDLCTCFEATAEVRISGIHSIEVEMADKVELGKDIEANVQILDEEGHALSVSVFSLVNLESVAASKIISVKSQISKDQKTKFIVHGDALGHTNLQFQATSNSKLLTSRQLPVQVFPPFKLLPKNVTLMKGAMFQVASIGGPEPQLNIEFHIEDSNVALVSNAGIIEAKVVGNTKVYGHVSSGDSSVSTIYSQDEVNVQVVQLTAIKIHVPLTRIQTNSEVPMYVVGMTDQESPFSFGTANPPVQIEWSISNMDIASIKSTYHKVIINPSTKNNFAMRLITKQQGQVTIRVRVTDFSGEIFTDEIQLHIFEKLKTKLTDEYGLSVLMTPNTETYMKTNRDGIALMNFKLHAEQISGLLTVDPRSGKLVSGDKTGEAMIQVTAKESFGIIQKMAVVVKVKPINYLMITADTSIRSVDTFLDVVPLGLNLKFSVGFFDNVGQKFDATSSTMRHRFSRFDLLHLSHGIENNTFTIHASKQGDTILKVWDNANPRISDYIKISVGNAISPTMTSVTLGDIVCFSCDILSDDGHSGFWYISDNNNILSLIDKSGIVVARDVGIATLNYNVSASLVTSTEVEVQAISSVHLDSTSPRFISNIPSEYSFNVSVNLYRSDQERSNDNSCGSRLTELKSNANLRAYAPFTCELSFTDAKFGVEAREVFSVSASYNPIAGCHQCQIKTIPTLSSGLRHQLSSLETEIEVTARIMPQGRHQKEVVSRPLRLPFFPQFFIHVEEVTLSNLQSSVNIEISSAVRLMGSISVIPSDSNMFQVLPPESDVKNPQTLIFPVELKDSNVLWETDIYKKDYFLKVKCSASKQRLEVPIRLKLYSPTDSAKCMPQKPRPAGWVGLFQVLFDNYQNWLVTTLSIIGSVAALFIGYRALFGQSSNLMLQNSAFLQPGMMDNSHMTHAFDSPWVHSHAPRTTPSPKPYLYSVENSPPRLRKSTSPFRSYSSSFNRDYARDMTS